MASKTANINRDNVLSKLDFFLNNENPPEYTAVPEEGHRTLEKAIDSIGDLVQAEHEVVIYSTNKRPKDKPDAEPAVGGSLQIGLKTHGAIEKTIDKKSVNYGLEKLYVRYRPFKGEWYDISSQVQRVAGAASEKAFHIHKAAGNTDLSAWSFDIFVTDIGREGSSFTGSITINETEWLWEGSADGVQTVKSDIERFTEIAPADLKGSPQELMSISPLAWEAHDKLQYGQDAAQFYGERITQKMMWHALDEDTRKDLLPNVPSLSDIEQSIVNDNKAYLKRMATHMLAEEIKKMTQLPAEMRDPIPEKADIFMRMMGAKTAPPKGSNEKDPVEEYGWSRKTHAELVKELQKQCQDVSMRSYELGYIEAVPEWKEYTANPAYWYKYITWWVQTDGFLSPFKFDFVRTETQVPKKDPGQEKKEKMQSPVGQDVYEIANKLRLLQRYIPNSDRKGLLPITQITSKIELEGHLAIANSRKVDLHLVKDLRLAMEQIEKASNEQLQASFKNVSDDVKAIQKDLSTEGVEIVEHLSNHNTEWWKNMKEWWARRAPVPVENAVPTWEEMIEAMERDAYQDLDVGFDHLGQNPNGVTGFCRRLRKWVKRKIVNPVGNVVDKVKNKIPFTLKAFFKFIGRSLLLTAMIWQLADGARGYAHTGLMISLITAESLSFGAWITRGVLLHFWADRGIPKAVAGWLTRSAVINGGDSSLSAYVSSEKGLATVDTVRLGKVFFGDITKIVRIALLVGVVFSIIVAYDELQRADEVDEYYRPAFKFYQTFQMALGIFEGLLIVTEMFAEFMTWTSLATACGPLMIVACVIGIVLIVWWYFYAKDMALHPIKVFLQNKAKPMDAFNGELKL